MHFKTRTTTGLGTGTGRGAARLPLAGAVFASGMVGVAVAVLAGVTWGLHVEAESRERSRMQEVRSAAGSLARAAGHLLEREGLEELPALLADAAVTHDLGTCLLRVPGGEVLAEAATPTRVLAPIPEVLSGAARRVENVVEGKAHLTIPVRVGDRGELALEVAGTVAAGWDVGLAKLGGPLVAAVSVLGLLMGHKAVLRRLRALGLIGSALEAARNGQDDAGALAVSEALGEYSATWNGIVQERDTLRRYAAFKDAAEPSKGGSVSSDLSAACDALTQGILILDDRLRVKYANGAAVTLLAVKREDLMGSDVRKHVNDVAAITAFEGVVSGKVRQRVSVETTKVGPQGKAAETSGERAGSVLRFSARPVRREEQGVAMVVVEDVTQQKVADEARNNFVAQATHELRTPLTNIRLYTESMIEDGENAEMRTKALNVISSESRRLERIVSDMLSVSEIEAGTLKIVRGDVRLDQLFEELREDYRALAEDKEIALAFELPPKLPVLSGDRDKLALALHNLLGNAIKYTPAGGKVTVQADEVNGFFTVHVADNGIGIRKEEHELIFDRFYRAKDSRVASLTGTGLGLTLARDIARLHGGDIALKSEVNQGSTFTLEVPLAGPGSGDAGAIKKAA